MAVTFIKRSTLPAPVKGKAGTLSVVVTKNGQIQLSKMTKDVINGGSLVLGFDGPHVYLFGVHAKAVAKVDPKDYIKLNTPKKGGTASFSASFILDHATEYGASHVYPFRQSGNQTFTCAKNEAGYVTFDLPASALSPKPVVKRVKKPKVAAGTAANPGETVGIPVNGAGVPEVEQELVLALEDK